MCDYHHLTIYQLKLCMKSVRSYSKMLVVESLLKYSEQSGLGFIPNLLACLRHNTHSLEQKIKKKQL